MSEEELYYDEDEVVDNEYDYNEHGVCINPKGRYLKCMSKFLARVEIAPTENGHWTYGLLFQGLNQGWKEPVLWHSTDQYTQQEAYNAGCERMIYLISNNNDHKKYDAILQMVRDEMKPTESTETTNQLTLF